MSQQNKSYRPLLKWAGGKRWLLPTIEKLWRPHAARRYVEPFAGGAGLAFGLMPVRALLSDANSHLINFYRHVKRGLPLDIELRYEEKLFYQHRNRFNALISNGGRQSGEAAQLFYYLNRSGFNGLCRFNSGGWFNVPFGKYKCVEYESDLLRYRRLFRRWKFMARDFEEVTLEPSDFIYCDPPYSAFGIGGFDKYTPDGFSWEDQVRLAEWLTHHRGPVLVSNHATPQIVRLYRKLGFRMRFINGPRRISANGDRCPAREVLATRNL